MVFALQLSALGLAFALWLYCQWIRSPLVHLPLPPGPKPLPIIGNLLDIPTSFVWETYHQWSKEFDSDIIHVNAAGTSIVILESYEAVVDLLEKRSSLYSSRIRLPMVNELMGWDFGLGFMPYGGRWRSYRRLFNQAFNERAFREFHPRVTKAAHQLLVHLIDKPGDINQKFRLAVATIILGIAYGIPVQPENDPNVTLAEKAMHVAAMALVPGAFLVDRIPLLKYVPAWFPGASFRRKAKEWKILTRDMIEKPYMASKKLMGAMFFQACFDQGVYSPSFVLNSLERLGEESQSEMMIQDVAGAMFSGGTDTTISASLSFVYAMIKYPDIQRKAQEELDRVIKPGHLPTLEDEEFLPYTTAIVKEVLRWKPATPIGVPHCSTMEDVYKGYRIPVGSIVIGNSWAIFYNEKLYPEPETFNPDRFMKDGKLNPGVLDPKHVAFGFGRRICPGRYMAWSSLWIMIASILATMDITKAVDENGIVIEPSGEYESGVIHIWKPFTCSVKPRSKEAEEMVRSIVLNEE